MKWTLGFRRLGRLLSIGLIGIATSVLLLLVAFPLFGLVWNRSDSLPVGIYRKVNAPLQRGAIVMFCLSGEAAALTQARGYVWQSWLKTGCEHDLLPLMKPIAALPHDHIEQNAAGIFINGIAIANSARINADGAGRQMPIPDLPERVPKNHLLLLSTHNLMSWDSRYYGVIAMNQVRAVLQPLLIFTQYAEEK